MDRTVTWLGLSRKGPTEGAWTLWHLEGRGVESLCVGSSAHPLSPNALYKQPLWHMAGWGCLLGRSGVTMETNPSHNFWVDERPRGMEVTYSLGEIFF